MTLELKKRILTSITLFIVVIFAIVINKIIFIFSIFAVSVISFYEWSSICIPQFYKKRKKGIIYTQIVGLVYIFIFFITSFLIYEEFGKIFFIR